MSVSDLSNKAAMSGTSRRTVVRTAAHAAWAVPAVQIVSAVPAFAAVSNEDVALFGTPSQAYGTVVKGERPITVSGIQVVSDGPTPLDNRVALTLSMGSNFQATTNDALGAGWIVTAVNNAAGKNTSTLTVRYTGGVPVGTAPDYAVSLPDFTVIGAGQNATITAFAATLV